MKSAVLDASSRSTSWYARVPTHSNPADGPSRMRSDSLKRQGAFLVTPWLEGEGDWFVDVLR